MNWWALFITLFMSWLGLVIGLYTFERIQMLVGLCQ